MSKIKTQLVIEGENSSKKMFREVDNDLSNLDRKLQRAGKTLIAAFSVSAFTGAIRAIANTSDAYNLMNARLGLATDSQEEFNVAQAELERVASATQAPLESLVTLYTRIARPLKEAGRTQSEIIQVTEAVATSFRISGASAQEAENGVIQFAQALGAGALRGDEFNSVAEQAPRLMQALADSLGVSVGALKDMAGEGELTADVVTDALVGSLATLRAEAETLPQTVGGAMVELEDKVNKAVGQADLTPLIQGISSLGETLSDPRVIENLARLVNALVSLAGLAAEGGARVVDFGDDLGYIASRIAGSVDEISRAEKEIAYWQAGAEGFGLVDLLYTDEYIERQLKAWTEYRDMHLQMITGVADDIETVESAAQDESQRRRDQQVRSFNTYVNDLKKIQEAQLDYVKDALKEQAAAEKKALAEIESVKKKRLDIEKRYSEALASLSGGGGASYGQAQSLKLSAQQALANGDIESAQAYAQQAVEVLQELARAGENTYGFEGFIKELRSIELAANDIETEKAQNELKAVRQTMADVREQAAALENMPVSLKLDDAQLNAVRQQIMKLAQEMGQELILPVTITNPSSASAEIPGFATGTSSAPPGLAWVGENGPELVSFAGGETVFTAEQSRRLAASMPWTQVGNYGDMGGGAQAGTPLYLTLGDRTFGLQGDSSTIEDLARFARTARLKRR